MANDMTKTRNEKFDELNALRESVGKKPLSSWKQSEAKLDEAIAVLLEGDCSEFDGDNAASLTVSPEQVEAEVDAKPKKGSVKNRTIELLTDETSRTSKEIAQILVDELGAKFSPASVAWYASKLRKENVEVSIADGRKKS